MTDAAFINKLGGRKLCITILVFVTVTFFLAYSKLEFGPYVECIKLMLAVYLAGNVSQSFLSNTLEKNGLTTEAIAAEQEASLGRKFYFVLVVFTAISVMFYLGKLPGSSYIEITNWVLGIYVSGNVLDKVLANGLKFTK